MAHLHNLVKQNNNFSLLKNIENPLLNPLKIIPGMLTMCIVCHNQLPNASLYIKIIINIHYAKSPFQSREGICSNT